MPDQAQYPDIPFAPGDLVIDRKNPGRRGQYKGIARNGMNRLSVAYGLSFLKEELAQFKLPGETPKATVIWRPKAQTYQAASKDDC